MQADGHEVGAVVFQIQSTVTDRRAPAEYTPVAIACPTISHSLTDVWLTHTVSADGSYDIQVVLALPDC